MEEHKKELVEEYLQTLNILVWGLSQQVKKFEASRTHGDASIAAVKARKVSHILGQVAYLTDPTKGGA